MKAASRFHKAICAGICIAIASTSFTSCASIISGTTQDIVVSSNAPHATLTVNNEDAGELPSGARVARKQRNILKVSAPGYQTRIETLDKGLNPWVFGNILIGGIVGIIIDFVSGAVYKFDDEVNIKLEPLGAAPAETPQPETTEEQ